MSRRIPVLETGRLIIRELTMDDLDSINNILNHANGSNITVSERQAWLQWTVLGYEMFAMLEQPHYGERAIALKDTGELIGAVGIVPYIDTFNRIPAFHRAEGFSSHRRGRPLLGHRSGLPAPGLRIRSRPGRHGLPVQP
jgi:RimJ/RimL family protein N-acetyltransferase